MFRRQQASPASWQVGVEDGIPVVHFENGHGIELEILSKAYNRVDAEDYGIPLDVLDEYEDSRMADYTNYGAGLVRFLERNVQ